MLRSVNIDYKQILKNVLLVRLKYLMNLILIIWIIPSFLLAKFRWKAVLLWYPAFISSSFLQVIYCYKFMELNMNNVNHTYFRKVNWLKFGAFYGINIFQSVIFSVLLNTFFFKIKYQSPFKIKHAKDTVNPDYVYFYVLALGFYPLFAALLSTLTNEYLLNMEFTKTTFQPVKRHLKANLKVFREIPSFVISFTVSLILFHLCFSQFFIFYRSYIVYFDVFVFGIFMKLFTVTVLRYLFESYMFLGCFHFNQYVSTCYENYKESDTQSLNALFDAISSNDDFSKFSSLQELDEMVRNKYKPLYDNIIYHYNLFYDNLTKLLDENVNQLFKEKLKASTVDNNNGRKIDGKFKYSYKDNTKGNLNNKHNNNNVKEKNILLGNQSNSVFRSSLRSMLNKLLTFLQDEDAKESHEVVQLFSSLGKKICKNFHHFKFLFLSYLKIKNVKEKIALRESIKLYYTLNIFICLLRNSGKNIRLNNRILLNIGNILVMLHKSIKFSEIYLSENLDQEIVHGQKTNQYLVKHLHENLKRCFIETVIKYADILADLNLDKDVVVLANVYLRKNQESESKKIYEYSLFE